MYSNIVVPLDGFVMAEDALPTASRIAVRTGARVHLVHVLDMVTRPPFGEQIAPEEWWGGAAERLATEYLTRMAARIQDDHDIEVSHAVRDGAFAEAILDEAQRRTADLIVMTCHGKGMLRRLWVGSVADAISRESPVPVLFLRCHERRWQYPTARPFSKILVPLDGSELAEQILPKARELCEVDHGSLHLVRVVQPTAVPIGVVPFVMGTPSEPDQFGDEYLDDIATTIDGATTEVHTTTSPVADQIVGSAAENHCDAIAMTTHGYGGLKRAALGSVANQVLRTTGVPLLLYRPAHTSS